MEAEGTADETARSVTGCKESIANMRGHTIEHIPPPRLTAGVD